MTEGRPPFEGVTGFQWDHGNSDKNWLRHKVTQAEIEQVFFNHPLLALVESRPSSVEVRYFAFGPTNEGRLLTMVFARRGEHLRVSSARPISRRERRKHDETKETQANP